MPSYVSPGVYVVEKDISDYPPTVNSSVVGIVGFASKGPIAGESGDRATLITSQNDLMRIFGEPNEAITGQALEGALEILEGTNSIRFIRCASGALYSSASVRVGACPAVHVSGSPMMTDGGWVGGIATPMNIGTDDSTTSSVRFKFNVYDNAGTQILTNKKVQIDKGLISASSNYDSSSHSTIVALKKAVGGALDSSKVIVEGDAANTSAFFVGAAAGSGAYMTVSGEIYNSGESIWQQADNVSWLVPVSGMLDGGADGAAGSIGGVAGSYVTGVTASGTTFAASGLSWLAKSLYPGEGYDAGTRPDGSTSGHSVEVNVKGSKNFEIQVNEEGKAAETFKCNVTSGLAWIEDQVGLDVENKTSDWITGYFVSGNGTAQNTDFVATKLNEWVKNASNLGPLTDLKGQFGGTGLITETGAAGGTLGRSTVNPRFVKLIQGTYNLAGGDNGIPPSDDEKTAALIGEENSAGGKTGIQALDDDLLNISIALVPGFSDLQSVQNNLVTLAEASQNFIALMSPPYAVGRVQDAIEWHNGFGQSRTAALNSSYAALYWPWLKVFSVHDAKDRWYDPAIFAARQYCVTDSMADPWFAPAGYVRGRLTKPVDTEVDVNQGDRDSLYSGGNAINPIANFPQQGITIFGQRTTQREPTALDRVNIRRMLIVIRKMILAATRRLVFEPNDPFTWKRVQNLLNPMLDDIRRRRGITEFRVVCDGSTNTPVRIDRNEMWTKVIIKPTKTAEILIFEVNVTNQSAQLGSI